MAADPCLLSLRKRLLAPGPLVGFESDLLTLKKYSRTLHAQCNDRSDEIRTEVGQTNAALLSLQSAEYEKQYYLMEIPLALATPVFDSLALVLNGSMEEKLNQVKAETTLRQALTAEIEVLNTTLKDVSTEVLRLEGLLRGVNTKVAEVTTAAKSLRLFLSPHTTGTQNKKVRIVTS